MISVVNRMKTKMGSLKPELESVWSEGGSKEIPQEVLMFQND